MMLKREGKNFWQTTLASIEGRLLYMSVNKLIKRNFYYWWC